jgi:hypothetical protein
MGLISKFGTMRMKKPVDGTLSVVSINMPDPSATSQNYRIDGVVSGPGLAPTAVAHRGVASLNKWPNRGDILPVTFDLDKPDRMVVHWDRLDTGQEQAVSAAEAVAEQMRRSSTSSPTSSRPQQLPTVNSFDIPAGETAVPDVGTTDAAGLQSLNALLQSGAGNVVRLDPQSPDTAALREMLLRAVGQVEAPQVADPDTEERTS